MSQVPLCSSRQVVSTQRRAGFVAARRSKGSHQAFVRTDANGRQWTTIVPLGKAQIPRGTLQSILDLAGLSTEQFRRLL